MPPFRAVQAAGRFDLHNAIKFHGGYRAVADELGWPRWVGLLAVLLLCHLSLSAARRGSARFLGTLHSPLGGGGEAAVR